MFVKFPNNALVCLFCYDAKFGNMDFDSDPGPGPPKILPALPVFAMFPKMDGAGACPVWGENICDAPENKPVLLLGFCC